MPSYPQSPLPDSCGECGHPISEKDVRCGGCGLHVFAHEFTYEEVQEAIAKAGRPGKFFYIALGLVAVFMIFSGIMYLITN